MMPSTWESVKVRKKLGKVKAQFTAGLGQHLEGSSEMKYVATKSMNY